jgi:E3 ubiquitin-protein ligase TRIP12
MSSRVTRSSARLSTASNNNSNTPTVAAQPPTSTRKRKAAAAREASPEQPSPSSERQPRKKAKRGKAPAEPEETQTPPVRKSRSTRKSGAMSSNEHVVFTVNGTLANYDRTLPAPVEENSTAAATLSSTKRKTTKKKETKKGKVGRNTFELKLTILTDPKESSSAKSRTKRSTKKKAEEPPAPKESEHRENEDHDEDIVESEDEQFDEDEQDDNEPDYDRAFPGGVSRFESAMRNIHGVITRTMSDLRIILDNLRRRDDPTAQRTALEELAQVLLMSNEDTLAGHFSPDPYIKELIPLMEANEVWGENPEMMLMACRCISNMMEAVPASTANIVYGGAVPILCKKLLEIHFIDVAEQALSVSCHYSTAY